MTKRRTSADLVRKLEERLRMLATSARLFDEGDEAEGDRIAGEIALLFETKGMSHGLLDQVGLHKINVRSSYDSRRVGQTWNHLVRFRLETQPVSMQALPMGLDTLAWTLVRKDDWWSQESVIGCGEVRVSRRQLVLWIRDKDDAHVDASLPQAYLDLQSWFGFSMHVVEPWEGAGACAGEVVALQGVHRACMRQLAHEILSTPALRAYLGARDGVT